MPVKELALLIGRPRTKSGIAHSYAALLGKRSGEAGGGPRQVAQQRLRHRAQQRLRFGQELGRSGMHDV